MRAGRLRHRIAIEQATEARNSIGEVTLTFPGTVIATVWAERLEVPATEGIAADQVIATRAASYRIRHRSDVRSKQRVHEGSRVWDIESTADPDGRRRELVLTCLERGV